MATSSLLGIDTENLPAAQPATGIDRLGPSDASDSGSDSAGAYGSEPDSDTDRFGTGERSSVQADEQAQALDIVPDHIVRGGSEGTDYADTDSGDELLDDESVRLREDVALTPDDLPGGNGTDDDVEREDDETRGSR